MLYKEKVTSMSLSSVFVINKYDIFFHMSLDTRIELAKLVLESYLNPPSTSLFENVVQKFGEKDWRIHKSWRIFKQEIPGNLGYQIQDSYKTAGKDPPLNLQASGNVPTLPKVVTNQEVLTVSKFHHMELESSISREEKKDEREEDKKDDDRQLKFHISSMNADKEGRNRRKKSQVRGSVITKGMIDSMVFTLVQYHREVIKLKPAHLPTSPRMSKMYMQFCGAMHSSEDAQAAASSQLLNHKIANADFDYQKLQWKPFVGIVCILFIKLFIFYIDRTTTSLQ